MREESFSRKIGIETLRMDIAGTFFDLMANLREPFKHWMTY